VRVDPTLAVPVTVGVALTSDPLTTAAVAAEVRENVVKPVLDPVTLTVRIAPRSSGTGVYVAEVAPVIAPPERYH
jgi:hypothetical protein